MDNRRINDRYCEIAQELIWEREELASLRDAEVTILCLSSEHEKKTKKKIVYGQCEKIADKYKWGIPCDFTITIFEPNVIGFSDEQIKILIFHELLHVGVDGEKMFIRPHDLEDFKTIIDEFGVDWDEV
jgi:hypothetical protein